MSVLTVYCFVVIFFFLNLDKFFSVHKFKDLDSLNFYKSRSKIMNHLRNPAREIYVDGKIVKSPYKNDNEFIFNQITKGSKKTILFQGDSWVEIINYYPEAKSFLEKNFRDFSLFNAGITSYSPSLMKVQLDYLVNIIKMKPNYLVLYIDQTDIGDENCRYKYLKKYNSNNSLISVPYEEYPISGKILNMDKMIKLNEILLKNSDI